MKRTLFSAGLLATASAALLIFSCADPLQQNGGQGPVPPPGPHTDTIYIVDTVVVIDTVMHIDTVFVPEPGECCYNTFCSHIGSGQHKIVWLLRNSEGRYHLEFGALTERDQPVQKLFVDINGEKFCWSPAHEHELVIDRYLTQNAVIRIYSDQPCAFGHEISICLTVSRPNHDS
jgi:hypothetical protein